MKKTNVLTTLLMIMSVLSVSACSEKDSDLKQWVASVKKKPVKPLDPIPSVEEKKVEDYNGQGKRDPFVRVVSDIEQTDLSGPPTPRPDVNRPRQHLEGFDLDELIMVGTLGLASGDVALIRTPDGVTHKVTPGKYMGRYDGQVISVSKTSVVVKELLSDGAGSWVSKERSIVLSEKGDKK